jgi:hypothetical protein
MSGRVDRIVEGWLANQVERFAERGLDDWSDDDVEEVE